MTRQKRSPVLQIKNKTKGLIQQEKGSDLWADPNPVMWTDPPKKKPIPDLKKKQKA
jgi:hypothetical protein